MAISLPIKRKARIKNVLEQQHIQPKRPIPYFKIFLSISTKLCLFFALTLPPILIFKATEKLLFQKKLISVANFHIEFKGEFPEKIQNKIWNSVDKNLAKHRATLDSLEGFAQQIQAQEGLSQVHVFLDIANKLTISVSPRTPVMTIMTDKERYVSSNAEIYEDTNFSPPDLLYLEGVFAENRKDFSLDEKSCITLSDREKKIITEAIQLMNMGKMNATSFSKIEYKNYRGFFATLKETPTVIVFGNPPFDKQFSRLSKVINEAKKKSTVLSKIEIDYNDKAFITEQRI